MGDGRGIVYLVGAGPGDPGLLTRRGAEVLGRADVVVYDGLANAALLDLAPESAERIYAGKKRAGRRAPLSQEEINRLLRERARRGQVVVRLKGGDPFVFGRGGEEAHVLAEAGVRFELVPGVSAATAVPAYAGIPLTHRDAASSVVAVTTGHETEGKRDPHVDWEAVARHDTIVLFMAVTTLDECAARLVQAGRDPATPAAVIHWGTTPAQRTVVGTLADIAERCRAGGIRPPALVVAGRVVEYRTELSWYEARPLFGARVLVPRAREQGGELADRLRELGAEALLWPLTRIVPDGHAELEGALAALPDGCDWVVFTSANAVAHSFEALARAGRDARALGGVQVAAVGQATSSALARHGIVADLVAGAGGEALARALLAKVEAPSGLRVLWPRARDAAGDLEPTLLAAGVRVTGVVAYRSEPVPAGELGELIDELRAGRLDILTFFAPSQVRALCAALGQDAPAVLGRARLRAAIGETTRVALEAAGVTVDVVPASPTRDALLEALVPLWSERKTR